MRKGFNKTAHHRSPRKKRVIVLEEMNFLWDEPELEEIVEMWEQELSIQWISNHFDRDPDEVLLDLLHLAKKEKITKRNGGLLLGL